MISIGAGEELVSEYRSVTFYHCGKPEWVETIKVMFSYYSSLLTLLTSIYRGRQWETASLITRDALRVARVENSVKFLFRRRRILHRSHKW